jgi:plastocyanin
MHKVTHRKFPVARLVIIGGLVAMIGAVAYFGFASRTSVVPSAGGKNFSLKISDTSKGIAFVSVGTQGRKTLATGHNSPTFDVNVGDTVTFHIINEVHGGEFDLIIPDLNVHSKPIGYFEADTVTFVVEKRGEFIYTSTGHPEMKGLLVVQ